MRNFSQRAPRYKDSIMADRTGGFVFTAYGLTTSHLLAVHWCYSEAPSSPVLFPRSFVLIACINMLILTAIIYIYIYIWTTQQTQGQLLCRLSHIGKIIISMKNTFKVEHFVTCSPFDHNWQLCVWLLTGCLNCGLLLLYLCSRLSSWVLCRRWRVLVLCSLPSLCSWQKWNKGSLLWVELLPW